MARVRVPCTYVITEGNKVQFTPLVPISAATRYYVTVKESVKSVSGDNLATEFNSYFDLVKNMTLVSSDPSDEEIDVPTNSSLRFNFSSDIDESTINSGTLIVEREE